MTDAKAYQAGWDAARISTNLEKAEDRFTRKHGERYGRNFEAGWIDYAADNAYGHNFRG